MVVSLICVFVSLGYVWRSSMSWWRDWFRCLRKCCARVFKSENCGLLFVSSCFVERRFNVV